MKHLVAIFLLSPLVSCVPVQQQVIDARNLELQNSKTLQIQVSEEEFMKVSNPEIEDGRPVSLDDNFQSAYTLKKYGDIYAGKLVSRSDYDRDALKILGDYLVFSIQTGGYGTSPLIKYKVVWNGKYYNTKDGLTVDLVFSFKNLDFHRALVHMDFKVDLTPIMSLSSDNININFIGYDRLINFQYNTDNKSLGSRH